MTRRLFATAAALLLSTAPAACSSPCDDSALAEVAKTLVERNPDSRQRGFEALAKACPTAPFTLGRSLAVSYGYRQADERAQVYASRFDEPEFKKLFEQMCPRTDEERKAAANAKDVSKATRESCKIDRLGVISEDEPFGTSDMDALVLYEWMRSEGVGKKVARDVARSLMIVSADDTELARLCVYESEGCEAMFALEGIRPPQSSGSQTLKGSTIVSISPTAIFLERDAPIVELKQGRPKAGSFEDHLSPALLEAFEKRAAQGMAKAEAESKEWDQRMSFVVDRHTPWTTLIDTMVTASKAGYAEYSLAILDGGRIAGIVIMPAQASLGRAGGRAAGRFNLRFQADARQVTLVGLMSGERVFPHAGDCSADAAGCVDRKGLSQKVEKLGGSNPGQFATTFQGSDEVSVQTMVTLMDIARGEDCKLSGLVDETPTGCYFWQPIVDSLPSRFSNGNEGRPLKVRSMKASRVHESRPGGLSVEAFEELAAGKETAIARCFAGYPGFSGRPEAQLKASFMLAPAPDDPKKRVAGTFLADDGIDHGPLTQCLVEAVGLEDTPLAPSSKHVIDTYQVELNIEMGFGGARP